MTVTRNKSQLGNPSFYDLAIKIRSLAKSLKGIGNEHQLELQLKLGVRPRLRSPTSGQLDNVRPINGQQC